MTRRRRALLVLALGALVGAAFLVWQLHADVDDRSALPLEHPPDEGGGDVPTLAGRPVSEPTPQPAAPESRSVSGVVVDEGGAPVVGALVANLRAEDPGVVTDAAGRFSLPTSTRGSSIDLRVRAAGYAERWTEEFAVGTTEARVVLDRGHRLTGRVLDPDGRPLSGAKVWVKVWPEDREPVVTDAAGSFALEHLAAGSHVLRASAPGFSRFDRFAIEVPVSDVELRLRRGVVFEGTVRDRGGKPVVGASVDSEFGDDPHWQVAAMSDGQGTFRVADIPAVRRVVWVSAAGFAMSSRSVWFGTGPVDWVLDPERRIVVRHTGTVDAKLRPDLFSLDGTQAACEIEWTEGRLELTRVGEGPYTLLIAEFGFARVVVDGIRGDGPPVEVTMRAAPLSISGTLPIEDAADYVYAIPQGSEPRPPSRRPNLAWSSPDEVAVGERTFEVPNLVEGRYDILVMLDDSAGDRAGTIVHGVAAGTKDLAIELPKGEAIEGFVRSPDGAPARFEKVQAYDERGFCRSVTHKRGKSGAFRIAGLPAGRYKVVAWMEEGSTTLDDVAAPSSGVVVVAK